MSDVPADGARVLVVSDDPLIRHEARFGFPDTVEVLLATDSRDARELLAGEVPSVVVVDLQTGSAGGFNLAREMAAVERLQDVPIFMLLERDQDAWLARQAGARRYLTKPIRPSALAEETLALVT